MEYSTTYESIFKDSDRRLFESVISPLIDAQLPREKLLDGLHYCVGMMIAMNSKACFEGAVNYLTTIECAIDMWRPEVVFNYVNETIGDNLPALNTMLLDACDNIGLLHHKLSQFHNENNIAQ